MLPASAEGFGGGRGSGGDSFEACDENTGARGGERDVQMTVPVTMAEFEDKRSKN